MGRSVMISDFLVQHPSGAFFRLTEDEWRKAVQKFPELLDDNGLRYEKNSATVTSYLGADPYFDNTIILMQFERLFKMLTFKEDYRDHEIEILVDNARTHIARPFSIADFGKGIGTRCPVSSIEHVDDSNNTKVINLLFDSGPHKGLSKGLLNVALELGVKLPKKCKLDEIRSVLSTHQVFPRVSLRIHDKSSPEIVHHIFIDFPIRKLANNYGVKIIFVPTFHCELNPIEGVWCYQKSFMRKYNEQIFNTFVKLISQSRDIFEEKKVSLKLFRRFWKAVDAYNEGKSYSQVLQLFFSNLCKGEAIIHRRITNTNL